MAPLFCKLSFCRTAILLWLVVSFAGQMPGAPRGISAIAAQSPPQTTTASAPQAPAPSPHQATTPSGGAGVSRAVQRAQTNQEPLQPPLSGNQKRNLLKANFEKMKHDAGELTDLAKALQQELDKSNENILSLDVVEKASKIEKLAKRIKESARGY